jgi:serine/threonine-protein kinase HipA
LNRCPITYELCGEALYSPTGLRALSPNLATLQDFPYEATQQRREAVVRAAKMSIQGVQPKLSVRLNATAGLFEVVDRGGRYVIKPQHAVFTGLPENEGLTMQLARLCGIEVPLSGLVRCVDGRWSYFIRRFDRVGHNSKLPLEDFAQLGGFSRDTKYNASMEQLVKMVDAHCTFPAIEKVKLFKRSLFNFLVGNEDMHLKNFSLITRDNKVELAPAYDYLSSVVAYLAVGSRPEDIEEVALSLKGKKRNLTRRNWIDYFGAERLSLPPKVIDKVLRELSEASRAWLSRIDESFLPADQKELYAELLAERSARLSIMLLR